MLKVSTLIICVSFVAFAQCLFFSTQTEGSDSMENIMDIVRLRGDKTTIGTELREFLHIDKNIRAMRLDVQNGFGSTITLLLCKPDQVWGEVLVIVEPSGRSHLKDGALVFSRGTIFWLTDETGELWDGAYLTEELELKELGLEEAERDFRNIIQDVKQWIKTRSEGGLR